MSGGAMPGNGRPLESWGAANRELTQVSHWTVKAHQLKQHQAEVLANALLELDVDDPRLQERRYRTTLGGDHVKLRGLPAIGRGVSGAIPGSSPEQALITKERWRRRY